MDIADPAGEFLRITERYRNMSDDELLILIPQGSELTPLAQQALASEVRSRGLKTEGQDKEASAQPPLKRAVTLFEQDSQKLDDSTNDSPDADSSYEEDRKLVELCTVWSLRDALKVQRVLDVAGIPFFMGPEKATGVDQVTSNFANGVGVQIMQVGLPWAMPAMKDYEPEDDPTPKQTEELDELVVRCPKCHSAEVVFEGGTSTLVVAADDSSQRYKWNCDSCGNQWEDDGVAKEG
jgi:DNA-directed RNA polymerase subunit M/transcription elongation factor TFIIS